MVAEKYNIRITNDYDARNIIIESQNNITYEQHMIDYVLK